MSKLGLNSELLKSLYSSYGPKYPEALRRQWEERFRSDQSSESERAPDRATIYRWREGKLPRSPVRLLRLCGVLDIDPFAILEILNSDKVSAIHLLYRSFWLNNWRQPALSFLSEFFGHQVDWPPKRIAGEFFNRDWQIEEFRHDANTNKNYYAQIELLPKKSTCKIRPQIFHFAYSQPGSFAQRWIQYGFIERSATTVRLVNITGDIQEIQIQPLADAVFVDTWFGEEPALFRIASLHPFSIVLRQKVFCEQPSVRFSS